MNPDQLYLECRPLVDVAITAICRRNRLSPVDAEDLTSEVHQHLIKDNYVVLRKFEQRSTIKTFLLTVITHCFQDWRNKRWGKWRASAAAKRDGPLAEHLERLIVRDGLTFDEAFETLRTNFLVSESREALEGLVARFPSRAPRRFVSDEGLKDYPADHTAADTMIEQRDATATAHGVSAMLAAVVSALAPQDRLILRMYFENDLSIADIARALQLDQKSLYPRVQRLLAGLRADLGRAGLTASAVTEVLRIGGFDQLPDGHGASPEFPGGVRLFEKAAVSPIRTSDRRTP